MLQTFPNDLILYSYQNFCKKWPVTGEVGVYYFPPFVCPKYVILGLYNCDIPWVFIRINMFSIQNWTVFSTFCQVYYPEYISLGHNRNVTTSYYSETDLFWKGLGCQKYGFWAGWNASGLAFEITVWVSSRENLFMPYANNKGTDQPAHSRSLISTFIVHYLDSSIIPVFAKSKISRL